MTKPGDSQHSRVLRQAVRRTLGQTLRQNIILHINGGNSAVNVRPADTLLEVLRNELGLTGSKPGCENGDCGACTVLVNDWPYKSCIMLAIEAVGQRITTIEGLQGAPIQRAFVDCYAFQCGYCTPGFIMNAHGMLKHCTTLDETTIREWLESNICRCTSYEEIAQAVRMASEEMTSGQEVRSEQGARPK